MRIVINARKNQLGEYLNQVVEDFDNGKTSGYVDSDTYWELEEN